MPKPKNLPSRLTAHSISKLPIPSKEDGRYDVRDHQITNLYLTVHPSGKKSWVFRYRAEGKSKRYFIGSGDLVSPAKARTKAKSIAGEIANGADPNIGKQAERSRIRKA